MPKGNTSEATQDVYNYLYSQYFHHISTNRTDILWSGPFYIALFAIVLIGGFFLLSFYFTRVHRGRGELYGASSFAGSILERIGPVSIFTWVTSIVFTLWALYYIIVHIVNGQIY